MDSASTSRAGRVVDMERGGCGGSNFGWMSTFSWIVAFTCGDDLCHCYLLYLHGEGGKGEGESASQSSSLLNAQNDIFKERNRTVVDSFHFSSISTWEFSVGSPSIGPS